MIKKLNAIFDRQFMVRDSDRIIKNAFGPDVPSTADLINQKTNLIFVNQHYFLSGAKPLSPAVIELGGIHIQEAKPLEKV